MNWYTYANNNPLRFVDPTGLTYEDVVNMSLERMINEDMDLTYKLFNHGLSKWEQRKDNLMKLAENVDGDTLVGLAQAGLGALGYDLGPSGIDGITGAYTKSAVEHFQGLIGEKRTGELDEKTRNAIHLAAISGLTQDDLKSKPMGLIGKSRYWTREQWGAHEPAGYVSMDPNKTGVILHQTDGSPNQSIKSIQNDHIKRRKWSDIGYHFLIAGSGYIYEGRPLDKLGAHVAGKNTGNIGISFMGKFTNSSTSTPMTEAQITSGWSLIRSIESVLGIPHGRSHYSGHYLYNNEKPACPGYPVRNEFLPWTVRGGEVIK